jgi:hypothetical protein
VRRFILYCLATGTLLSATPGVSLAGTTGRRNTAIAATAVAVGAWSNGTGRAGRRNTALLATGGAAYAWKRYADKKKQERRPPRRVAVAGFRQVQSEPCCQHGRKLGHYKGKGHWKHHCKHHGRGGHHK